MRSYRQPSLALLAALCLAASATLEGTAVIYWSTATGDALFIAADSTVIGADGNATGQRVCKIVPGKRFAVALSGKVRFRMMSRDMRTGKVTEGDRVDLFDVARQVVSEAEQIDDAPRLFGAKAQRALDLLAATTTDQTLLDVLFAGFRDGKPAFISMRYQPVKDAQGNMTAGARVVVSCPPNCPRLGIPWGFGQIDPGLQTDWLRMKPEVVRDPVAMADSLLDLQIARRTGEGHPGFIQKPVDVLQITARGMKWMQRKPECPDIRE